MLHSLPLSLGTWPQGFQVSSLVRIFIFRSAALVLRSSGLIGAYSPTIITKKLLFKVYLHIFHEDFSRLKTRELLFFMFSPAKSPGTKASSKMKPIAEGMEDDVFEESSPSKSHHMPGTCIEEV